MNLYPEISAFVQAEQHNPRLTPLREKQLESLARYIAAQVRSDEPVKLNFICTHNSRRSHLGQVWAQAAAIQLGFAQVECFSGGTEVTRMNPRAAATLARAGCRIETGQGENPPYLISLGPEVQLTAYSKLFDDEANPKENFAAVMTCTDADQNCPLILGATRISLPYDDPKAADDTPEESERYDERCRQIATEMYWTFELARTL